MAISSCMMWLVHGHIYPVPCCLTVRALAAPCFGAAAITWFCIGPFLSGSNVEIIETTVTAVHRQVACAAPASNRLVNLSLVYPSFDLYASAVLLVCATILFNSCIIPQQQQQARDGTYMYRIELIFLENPWKKYFTFDEQFRSFE